MEIVIDAVGADDATERMVLWTSPMASGSSSCCDWSIADVSAEWAAPGAGSPAAGAVSGSELDMAPVPSASRRQRFLYDRTRFGRSYNEGEKMVNVRFFRVKVR